MSETRAECTCAGEAMDRRPDRWCPIHGDAHPEEEQMSDLREAVEELRDLMMKWPEAVLPRGSIAHRLTAILDAHPDQEDAGLRELAEFARAELPPPYRDLLLNRLDLVGMAPAPSDQEGERCGGSGMLGNVRGRGAGGAAFITCPGCRDCQIRDDGAVYAKDIEERPDVPEENR